MFFRKVSAAVIMVVLSAGIAQAKCDQTCKQNKAYYGEIWKTRQPTKVNGNTYYVAIVPDRKSALVYWAKGVKTTSLTQIEAAASQVSHCRAKDESVLSMLSGDPNTPIKTKVFRKSKYIRVTLKC